MPKPVGSICELTFGEVCVCLGIINGLAIPLENFASGVGVF